MMGFLRYPLPIAGGGRGFLIRAIFLARGGNLREPWPSFRGMSKTRPQICNCTSEVWSFEPSRNDDINSLHPRLLDLCRLHQGSGVAPRIPHVIGDIGNLLI